MKKRRISNKLAYTLIAIFCILLVGVGVYAFGTTDPATFGHSGKELDLEIEFVVASGPCTNTLTVGCPAGKNIISGGCQRTTSGPDLENSHPLGINGWQCDFDATSGTCYAHAICAVYNIEI